MSDIFFEESNFRYTSAPALRILNTHNIFKIGRFPPKTLISTVLFKFSRQAEFELSEIAAYFMIEIIRSVLVLDGQNSKIDCILGYIFIRIPYNLRNCHIYALPVTCLHHEIARPSPQIVKNWTFAGYERHAPPSRQR